MNIYTHQCSDTEVATIESKWRSEGFRLVSKTNEKNLLPMEYIKTSHYGTEKSFNGPRSWLLTRRNAD